MSKMNTLVAVSECYVEFGNSNKVMGQGMERTK